MPLVTFEEDADNEVAQYSQGRGCVLRSEHFEATKMLFKKGKGAQPHSHPEEQLAFVVSGRLLVTSGGETFEVAPGQATFNPSNVEHGVEALEDTVVVSFKTPLTSTDYDATGSLSS